MTIHIEQEGNRMDDYDFNECLKYAPFKKEEVEEIIACSPGGADGESWHYIVLLKKGRYGYVTGWCDYTGWGCREGGNGSIHGTAQEAVDQTKSSTWDDRPEEDEKLRKNLIGQVKGVTPYGIR